MSVTTADIARAAEPIIAACRKPLHSWTEGELHLVIAYATQELRRDADPRASKERQMEITAVLIKVVHDVASELERRHPKLVPTEETWRAYMVTILGAEVALVRGNN